MWSYEDLFSQLKRALASLMEQDLDQAEVLLMEVKEALEDHEEWLELSGEWNLLMAMCRSMEPDTAIPLLEKAKEQIGGRSKIVPEGTMMTPELYGPLYMYWKVPGKADETGEKLGHMLELYDSLCKGGYRCDLLYRAQLAYYRGEFESARSLLMKADGNLKKAGYGLDQICAAEFGGRLAVHRRSPFEWDRVFRYVCGMEKHEKRNVRETAEFIKCQMWMSVGLVSGIPESIQTGKFGVVSEGNSYRIVDDAVSYSVFPLAWRTHMKYLLFSGKFSRAINSADIAASLYGLHQLPIFESYLWLTKASAWHELGDHVRTSVCLKKAAEILVPDGLWLFIAEFHPILGDQIMEAIELFGEDVAAKYREFAKNYETNLSTTRRYMMEPVFREPLTEKEQEVARLAALGFKSEELGESLSISLNTVKYHLANIYKKLGVNNRVELRDGMESNQEEEFAFWI